MYNTRHLLVQEMCDIFIQDLLDDAKIFKTVI